MAFMPELDTDGDGLLDNWETEFGLDFTSAEDDDGANGDPDRDGATNVQEQMMGTDPLNPASVFTLTLTPLSASRYGVKWRTIPGRKYQLEYADDQLVTFTPVGGANWPRMALWDEDTHLDNTSTNQPPMSQRNYRVLLVP
jgi:hypothetical protein